MLKSEDLNIIFLLLAKFQLPTHYNSQAENLLRQYCLLRAFPSQPGNDSLKPKKL